MGANTPHSQRPALDEAGELTPRLLREWRQLSLQAVVQLDGWKKHIEGGLAGSSVTQSWNGGDEERCFRRVQHHLYSISKNPQLREWLSVHDSFNELTDLLRRNVIEANPREVERLSRACYQLLHREPQALLAVLALVDAMVTSQADERQAIRAGLSVVLHNAFLPLVEGLNIWHLKRRWNEAYYHEQHETELEQVRLEQHRLEKDRVAAYRGLEGQLRSGWDEHYGRLQAENYNRSTASLFRSSIPKDELHRALFLKIVCEREEACYLAECRLEQQGEIVHYLTRKSLYAPEENGNRRMQIGVRRQSDGRLIVARIGTPQLFFESEWGVLVDLYFGRPLPRAGEMTTFLAPSNEKQIVISKWTGDLLDLEPRSTVADFLMEYYPDEKVEFCTQVTVNGTPVGDMGYCLEHGDVVRPFFDRHMRKRQPLEVWQGSHIAERTRQRIEQITGRRETLALRGRNRLHLMLQGYLNRWGLKVEEGELPRLLTMAGFHLDDKPLNELYEQFGQDEQNDGRMCDVTLQYKMRGRLRALTFDISRYEWRDIRIAKCCRPTFHDSIIGNRSEGPHDPNNPRYGYRHELIIHRADCEYGPKPSNSVKLEWVADVGAQTLYGRRVTLSVRSTRGLLGEIMNLIYHKTTVECEYVHADAVNFGKGQAQVILLLLSESEWDLESALKLLKARYGEFDTRVENLAPDEVRSISHPQNVPPYRIATEGHLHKRESVFMVGRNRELERLKRSIRHDLSARIGIIGNYRAGKTWFLHGFRNCYNEPGRVFVYISMMDYSGEKRLLDKDIARIFYTRALRAIQDQYPRQSQPESKRPLLSLADLADWLRDARAATGLHFTFLLDEFSAVHDWVETGVVDSRFVDRFVSFLEAATGTAFVFVFQAAGTYGLTGQGYELQQLFEGRLLWTHAPIRIKPLPLGEVHKLMTEPVVGQYSFTPEAINYIDELTGGNPFIGVILGNSIWIYAHKHDLRCIDREDVQTVVHEANMAYDWRPALHQLFKKLSIDVKRVLALVAQWQMATGGSNMPRAELVLAGSKRGIEADQMKRIIEGLEELSLLQVQANGDGLETLRIRGRLLTEDVAERASLYDLGMEKEL